MRPKARQVALEQVKPYAVGHYWLGVANDAISGMGMLGLVACYAALSQQCGTVLSSHLAL
jgi:hypothetical protein